MERDLEKRLMAALWALRLEDKPMTPSDRAFLWDIMVKCESKDFLSEVVEDLLRAFQEMGSPHDF